MSKSKLYGIEFDHMAFLEDATGFSISENRKAVVERAYEMLKEAGSTVGYRTVEKWLERKSFPLAAVISLYEIHALDGRDSLDLRDYVKGDLKWNTN